MKVKSKTVPEFLSHLKLYFLGDNSQPRYILEQPLRSELFSSEQMEQHSMQLARLHILSSKPSPDQLLKRLADNEKVLLEVRDLFRESVKENYIITTPPVSGCWITSI